MKAGRVDIIGGSLGGLFAATLLRYDGWKVNVYERAVSGLAGKGAGLVPQVEVSQILEAIDRDDVMATQVIASERIFLGRDGDIQGQIAQPQGQISWDLLYAAFRDALPSSLYHTGVEATVINQSPEAVTVQFSDGSSSEADLVIGADGIGSFVREFVAPGTCPDYAGYAAFRGLATENALPTASADLLSGRFMIYDAPGSHMLGYLVASPEGSIEPGHRRYNWVWYRSLSEEKFRHVLVTNTVSNRVYSAPPGGLSTTVVNELRESARRDLPQVLSEVVVREPAPFVQGIFDYSAPQMVRGRVALLGDAAFVVRPHTAMGVSKAAGDAMALQAALRQNNTIEEALKSYESIRSPVGRRIAEYGKRLGANFRR